MYEITQGQLISKTSTAASAAGKKKPVICMTGSDL